MIGKKEFVDVWLKILIPYFVFMFALAYLSFMFWSSNKALSLVTGLVFVIMLAQLFFGRKMQDEAFRLQEKWL